MPNMKALALMVWDKTVFKYFPLYLYVKSETLTPYGQFSPKGYNLKVFGGGSLDDATCQIWNISSPYSLGQVVFFFFLFFRLPWQPEFFIDPAILIILKVYHPRIISVKFQ